MRPLTPGDELIYSCSPSGNGWQPDCAAALKRAGACARASYAAFNCVRLRAWRLRDGC